MQLPAPALHNKASITYQTPDLAQPHNLNKSYQGSIHCAVGSAEECRSKDQQGDIGGFLPPEDDSDISF